MTQSMRRSKEKAGDDITDFTIVHNNTISSFSRQDIYSQSVVIMSPNLDDDEGYHTPVEHID